MVWPGLGFNYSSTQSNWSTDVAAFNYYGINNLRIDLTYVSIPWTVGSSSPGGYAFFRNCALYMHSAGKWVTWGPSTNITLTSTTWPGYHDAVVSEATYLQTNNLVIDEFEIGNELESLVDGTTLTIPQLRSNVRQLAVDVKSAGYNLSPVSYAIGYGNSTNYAGWGTEGLGTGLDTVSVHPYGHSLSTQGFIYSTPRDFISNSALFSLIATLGNKCYISEFNIDYVSSGITSLSTEQQVTAMRNIYSVIRNSGVQKALCYVWAGYLNTNNNFAMQNTDGSYNPMFDVILGNDRRTFVP